MDQRTVYEGRVAARIDRLPLTKVQWQLAVLVEVTWGFIIFDTDGIGARLYPFVWRPAHVIDVMQYAVIQAMQVGLGILLGVFIMSWVADRYGRRPAILLATALGGLCIWPFAYVTDFGAMVFLSILSTLGVGGIVATHSVYLSEMTSPEIRNRVLLTSQGITALVAVGVNLLAFALIPGHWRAFLWISASIEIAILLPLLWLFLPESPRWLEAHGRHEEAERIIERYEARVQAAWQKPLPEPDYGRNPVVSAADSSWTELFTSEAYRQRTWVLIIVWLLAYAGLIYGVGAFAAVYMVDLGGNAHFVFLTIAVAYVALFLGFLVNARLGERVERRDVIFAMGLLFASAWVVAWIVPNLWIAAGAYVVSRIGTGLFLFNLY
ncbi:MAG: MFS transporter, partial [Proteobacteria bacterium]|nr:MFS transporter [Pseudomonadota bacterium]